METRTRDYRRTTLKQRHRPIVRALAEAFFDGELTGTKLDAFVDEVDRFMSATSKTLRFGLVLMLNVIELSPLFYFRVKSFSHMNVAERVHHLEKLEASKVAQLPLLVVSYKTLMTMLFYDEAGQLKEIGYSEHRERYRRRLV
jgi:hypothetical protein